MEKLISLMVVEDNPTLQKMLMLMAKRRGLSVLVFGKCSDAVDAIASGQNPDLILMDLSLPDRTGLECTGIIRSSCEGRVPIVAMTGHAMPGVREACLAAGMDDYLSKPFTFTDFNRLINRWLFSEADATFSMPNDTSTQAQP